MQPEEINEMIIKLAGFRNSSYTNEVYSGDTLVFKECTPKGLDYSHLYLEPTLNDSFIIKMVGPVIINGAFKDMVKLTDTKNKFSKPSKSTKHHIIEVEFNEDAK